MKKLYSLVFLILAFAGLLTPQMSSAQIMNFDNPVLISGVDNLPGATYRFANAQPGIDAIVTVDSLVNGAVLKDIDKTGWGYNEAFQPFIQPPNGINLQAYVAFTMKFVTASTFTPAPVPLFSLTVLDIDGSNNIKEFDIVNMNGGTATYSSIPSEILVTGMGPAFKAINVAGIGHGGPDTTIVGDIFTITNANISQLTIKAGTEGTNSSNTARKYSFFPGSVTYSNVVITLPVTLVSFSATLNKSNNSADLKWTTASEVNLGHFVIEKSTDGTNFSDAAIVFAAGNTTEKMNYAFSDKNINLTQAGMIYYRLRSVDNDGKNKLSETRVIRIGKQNEQAVTVLTYPNPVSNELRITIPGNWQAKKVSYQLYNNNGQLLIKNEASSSNQTETMNLSKLAPGFYSVRVICDNEMAQQKIIKQ